jgi:hypothetical protein
MTIVAGGDSMVWGSELADCPHGGPEGYSRNTFAALLAGSEYHCSAYPGISNKQIYFQIRDDLNLIKTSCCGVIVCWTWPGRDNEINSDKWIKALQQYLKFNNYPYLFTCVDNCIITDNPEIDWNQWYLFPAGKEANETTTPRGFYQWAVENKYSIGPDGHPLEDAHKDAVTLIKEKFDELVKKHY